MVIDLPANFAGKNAELYQKVVSRQLFQQDKVPVFLDLDATFTQSFVGVSQEQYYHDFALMLDSQWQVHHRFHHLVGLNPDFAPAVVPASLGCEVLFMDSPVGVPQVKPFVRDIKDLGKIKIPQPERCELMAKTIKGICYFREKIGEELDGLSIPRNLRTLGPFDVAALMRGVTDFFMDLHQNKPLVRGLLEITTETCIKWLETLEKLFGPFPQVRVGEDYAAFVSPQIFQEFVLPYTGKIFSHFRDKSSCFHSDGLFSYATLELVKRLNIDEFLGFSPELDIAKVREILGSQICLNGNVDPIGVMTYGSLEKVETAARDCIQKAGENGCFVLGPGGGLCAGVRPENIDSLVISSVKYGKLV